MRRQPTTPPDSSRLIVRAVAFTAVFTAGVAVLPFLAFAYLSPGLHIALDTADAVIALVVAFLVYGRFRVSARQSDLLLTISLVVLAVANLPLTVVPAAMALGDDDGRHLDAWAPLLVRTFGALLFAAAALTPRSRRIDRTAARAWTVAFGVLVLWLSAIGVIAADGLPPALPDDLVLDARRPRVAGHPALLMFQVLSFVLYAAAAFAFARAAARARDDFLRWLAAGAVLAAGARVHYLLFPSLYTDYLYTGDVLRFGFYLFLLIGAAREVRSYWSSRVEAAVLRGRRDLARELQDTVLPHLDEVVRESGSASPEGEIAVAARRALHAAEALTAEPSASEVPAAAEDLETALRDALTPVATRLGLALRLQVQPGLDVPERVEPLLAMACDAVRRAGFAGATAVDVATRAEPPALVVRDDAASMPPPRDAADALERIRHRANDDGAAVTLLPATTAGGSVLRVDWLL